MRSTPLYIGVAMLSGVPNALAENPLLKAVPVGDVISIRAEGGNGVSVAYNSHDDEFRVHWSDRRTGSWDVYARRVTGDGFLVGEEVTITDRSHVSETLTSVAYSSIANRYLVTWREQSGTTEGILVSASGGPIGPIVDVSNGGAEPSLVYNPRDDEFFLAARNFGGGGEPGIRGQRINAQGNPVDAGLTISVTGGPNGGVAYNSNASQYLAVWGDQDIGDLMGRVVNADGSFATDPFVVSPNFPSAYSAASVAYDTARDRYLVVFGQFSGGPVRGRLVGADGTLIGEQRRIARSIGVTLPHVAYDPVHGVFLVAWYDEVAEGVFLRLLDGEPSEAGNAVRITDSAASRQYATANTTGGGFLVTWHGSADGVAARRVGVFCAADVDSDGVVDIGDLRDVLVEWGASESEADVDGDGTVGLQDLLLVLAAWGTCP